MLIHKPNWTRSFCLNKLRSGSGLSEDVTKDEQEVGNYCIISMEDEISVTQECACLLYATIYIE
jgi:hypothetical protein